MRAPSFSALLNRQTRAALGMSVALPFILQLAACELLPIDLLPVNKSSVSTGGQGGVSSSPPVEVAPEPEPEPTEAEGGAGGQVVVLPPPPPKVLLVVDEVATTWDDEVEAWLEEEGRAVTRISELVVLPTDAEGFDLIVVSPTADRLDLGTTLKDVETPLLLLETTVAANHGLGAQRASSPDDSIVILDETHPVAGGFSGTVQICNNSSDVYGNDPSGIPEAVAVASGAVNTASIGLIAYEKGIDVGGEPLPGRRVAFGAFKSWACRSDNSWALFDAAADWLLEE